MSIQDKHSANLKLSEVRRELDVYINKVIELEQKLKELEHCKYYRVAIWGSKRMTLNSKYGRIAHEIAKRLAWEGIDIVTGGGPGLMEAATRGAKEGQRERQTKAKAVGLNILGGEAANSYLDIKRLHPKFTSRLEEFFRMSMAFVVMPGGIGTLLELFYAWQLLQEFSKTNQPVIMVGTEFWSGLIKWISDHPLAMGLLDEKDMRIIHITDSVDEVLSIILQDYERWQRGCQVILQNK